MSVFYDSQLRPDVLAAIGRLDVKADRTLTATLLATAYLKEILDLQRRIAEASEVTAEALLAIKHKIVRVSPPGPALLVVTSESGNMLIFKLELPWSTADVDVVSADLVVTVAGAEVFNQNVLREVGEVLGLSGNDGDTVHVSLTYIDDATPTPNRSSATEKDYVLADTIAPAAPGEVVLTVTSET